MLPDPDPLLDLDELERFAGLLDIMQAEGEVSDSIDSGDLASADFEDFEGRVVELARIDPVVFIQYAFGWPMQRCHCEWQDFLTANDRAVLWAPIEHGKSSQVSIARPIYELGRDPDLRIALISNTEGQAAKSLSVIKQQIELNPRVTAVFPDLKREARYGRRALWHDTAMIVQREDIGNKDPSIQALGVNSSIIMGSRIDLAIGDDINDFQNTMTAVSRKRTVDWFDAHVESRSTARGRVWMIGTAWHREDVMEVLAKRPSWKSKRYDAWEGNLWPDLVEVNGKLCGWPRWRLEKKRGQIPALEFNRQFRNKSISQEMEIFNLLAIEACFDGSPWDPLPELWMQFYVGVDLNVQKGEAHDKTSFFIGRPDGAHKIVHRIICDNMDLDDIIFWFYYIEARFNPVLFLVENNSAQDYVRQFFKEDTLRRIFEHRGESVEPFLRLMPRVEGFTTGKNKADPQLGLRGMTLEFEQKRWRIPDHKLTQQWKDELVNFDPMSHTPDILMSSWFFHSATMKYRPQRIRSRVLGGV
jgi:hypothetical protein